MTERKNANLETASRILEALAKMSEADLNVIYGVVCGLDLAKKQRGSPAQAN